MNKSWGCHVDTACQGCVVPLSSFLFPPAAHGTMWNVFGCGTTLQLGKWRLSNSFTKVKLLLGPTDIKPVNSQMRRVNISIAINYVISGIEIIKDRNCVDPPYRKSNNNIRFQLKLQNFNCIVNLFTTGYWVCQDIIHLSVSFTIIHSP